jgi:formate dehydrogenase maturation protein FdhE
MLQYPAEAYERWKTAYPELAEQISLIEVLHKAQRLMMLTPSEVACTLAPEEILAALASGSSLAIVDTLPLPDERWQQIVTDLVGAVVDHFPTEDGTHLLIQLQNGHVDVPILMLDVLDQNLEHVQTAADELEVEPDTLSFYASATLLPVLGAYAASIDQQLLQENWLQGYCPICGREPLFSIPGESSRELFCNQCHTQWRYPPRQCAFCRDVNAHAFVEEPQTGLEVEVCNRCKRFLRQVSAEQLAEIDPALLDQLTTAAAEHVEAQGYH